MIIFSDAVLLGQMVWWAAHYDQENVAAVLIEKGAVLNERAPVKRLEDPLPDNIPEQWVTPVEEALIHEHWKPAAILLGFGANIPDLWQDFYYERIRTLVGRSTAPYGHKKQVMLKMLENVQQENAFMAHLYKTLLGKKKKTAPSLSLIARVGKPMLFFKPELGRIYEIYKIFMSEKPWPYHSGSREEEISEDLPEYNGHEKLKLSCFTSLCFWKNIPEQSYPPVYEVQLPEWSAIKKVRFCRQASGFYVMDLIALKEAVLKQVRGCLHALALILEAEGPSLYFTAHILEEAGEYYLRLEGSLFRALWVFQLYDRLPAIVLRQIHQDPMAFALIQLSENFEPSEEFRRKKLY